jgi:hypothetical protein
MPENQEARDAGQKTEAASAGEASRPQKGGEAATTRFGMEDGDNTDVPATGVDPDRQSQGPRGEGVER